jgi:DNA-binding GntR family transcriptional regulator
MGAIRAISAPLLADRVIGKIEQDIFAGAAIPGTQYSLPELAEEHQVRELALRYAVVRLERDGLLKAHGDLIVVAPLDPGQCVRSSNLRLLVQTDLIERSASRCDPSLFDRLAALLPDEAPPPLLDNPGVLRDWTQMMFAVTHELSAPVASQAHLQVLNESYRASQRYINLGWIRTRGAGPTPSTESVSLRTSHLECLRALLEACRSGQPSLIRELTRRHNINGDEVALRSLASDYREQPLPDTSEAASRPCHLRVVQSRSAAE